MSGIAVILMTAVLFGFGYHLYGGYITRRLGVDDQNPTPAVTQFDGIDFIPAKVPVLLGHHFASIAGAGPIVGPVIAAAFGWIPVWLWIVMGSIFIGGMHDMSAIVISLRYHGKSIASVVESTIGINARRLYLLFCWATIVLVIAVFINIVAATFTRVPGAAASSVLFLALAISFGLAVYRLKVPLWPATLAGVVLLFGSVWIGNHFSLQADTTTWQWLLFGYIFIASVTPVWILLQPRDYLNSFLLYALIGGGLIGIFYYRPQLQIEGFRTFNVPGLGSLFPLIFVTVACGAISGFHSLVGSGTTSKQLEKESQARVIGYGGMLIEGLLAVVALVAVAALDPDEFSRLYDDHQFVVAFAQGIGRFIHSIPLLNIPLANAVTFTTLAVSAFALTSLDTATRIGRYCLQEFFEKSGMPPSAQSPIVRNRFLATFITVICGMALTFSGKSDTIWPIFGSANQLLAGLALISVAVWLAGKQQNILIAAIPAGCMLIVTFTALILLAYQNLVMTRHLMLGLIAIALLGLAVYLLLLVLRFMRVDHEATTHV